MGWAEDRVEDYRRGAAATWLERRMLEHANPVHFPIAVAASLGIFYGLWTHRWPWIVGSSALALAGHAYCWTCPSGARLQPDRSDGMTPVLGARR